MSRNSASVNVMDFFGGIESLASSPKTTLQEEPAISSDSPTNPLVSRNPEKYRYRRCSCFWSLLFRLLSLPFWLSSPKGICCCRRSSPLLHQLPIVLTHRSKHIQ